MYETFWTYRFWNTREDLVEVLDLNMSSQTYGNVFWLLQHLAPFILFLEGFCVLFSFL